MGLYHSGPYPGYNWIEVAQVNERLTFGARDVGPGIAISAASLRRLVALLGELIPPGGHLMLESESPGCAASIRNWDIPEGGREGLRKLQGFKPLDDGRARSAREARDRELRDFLASLAPGAQPDALLDARRRARRLLRSSRA